MNFQGGLIVIFGPPIVFTLVSMGFVRDKLSSTDPRPLIWTVALTWLSLALFYGSAVAFSGPIASWSAGQTEYDHDVCPVALGRGLSGSEQKPISGLRSKRT